MTRWYEKAAAELDEQLFEGLISQSEYREHMRDLAEELRFEAEEAARLAYDNAMGDR